MGRERVDRNVAEDRSIYVWGCYLGVAEIDRQRFTVDQVSQDFCPPQRNKNPAPNRKKGAGFVHINT
jgi:hypothetical protein